MSITVSTDIFCDGEGCSQWVNGTTGVKIQAGVARANARRAGWYCARDGKVDLCPQCRTMDRVIVLRKKGSQR